MQKILRISHVSTMSFFFEGRIIGPAEKKTQERAQKQAKQAQTSTDAQKPSVLDGIPSAAPALLRAQLIGEKAATIGFDWPSVEGALAKVDEERLEVAEALARGHHQDLISCRTLAYVF